MAAFALAVLLLATHCHFNLASSATWCICKDASDAILQKTLDYACGAGADCNPIHLNGVCFQPNTVRAHCSYAVNSFFQRKGQGQGTCDFAGTATPVTSDPSISGCAYPSSVSAAGTSTTPVTTTPSVGTTPSSTGTPSTTKGTPPTTTGTTPSTTFGIPSTTTGSTPYSTTPGVLGGIGTGMGPSGVGIDDSHGGLRLLDIALFSPFSITLFYGLIMLLWG